ncbi:MAG: hypothetical protein IH986_05395 [Planctomycetes bacterium]|nr:hypothetical protein [Planctomycetota bacterium]
MYGAGFKLRFGVVVQPAATSSAAASDTEDNTHRAGKRATARAGSRKTGEATALLLVESMTVSSFRALSARATICV